ncbi:MAG: DUF1501 domain-containing protein, partial [Planctomycetota bacterium]
AALQPATRATINNIKNDRLSSTQQRQRLNLIQQMNRQQSARENHNEALEAVIDSYELAARMQMTAPGVLDIRDESPATLAMYGIGRKETDDFGRMCLKARRLAERGVRFIQVNYADESNTPMWDQHNNMPKHADHAKATDLPVAGLLADLKQRGLLEDTLVWWGGEFGRTPFTQNNMGRDHNPRGFTTFLAGGGVKKGFSFGETDDIGGEAVADKVHMHDLHATILHLMGLDHEKLTFRHDGRDYRLTDIAGEVAREIIA